MTQKHDYAKAIAQNEANIKGCETLVSMGVKEGRDMLTAYHTISHALRFAEKMMQSPSEEMYQVGSERIKTCEGAGIKSKAAYAFVAMRDQALKELEER